MEDFQCEVGNERHHVWCFWCNRNQFCMKLPKMPGYDIFNFQEYRSGKLSIPQEVALSIMQDIPGRHLAIEVCNRYSTLIALWKRGLIRCVEDSPHLSWQTSWWIARNLDFTKQS